MANMYRSVLAGGGGAQPTGDAVAADVLTGKTFSNAQATGISGTMPNNGAVSGQATPSQPYTIPAGYHNGSGVVTASGVQLVNGSIESAPAASTKITLGFKPKVLIIENVASGSVVRIAYYNEDISTTTYLTGAANTFTDADTFGSAVYKIESIDNDGFTIAQQAFPIRYTAIG